MSSRLTASQVLVVDCQSTGSTPQHGHLIELGWARFACDVEDYDVAGHIVALPEGASLPRMVSRITGIGRRDVEAGVSVEAAWRALDRAATAVRHESPFDFTPTVIHFKQFEEKFLEDLYTRHDQAPWFRYDIVCTHAIAQRLLPELPRRSLRALAGYFGFSSAQLRRSRDHVEATCFVWRHLVELLEREHDVCTWEELATWLAESRAKRPGRRYPMPREKRLALPDAPGVYRFLRSNGDLLYVGKATSLKKRVNSHFSKKSKLSERTLEMLTQARDLAFVETRTALEAALLESDAIKTHAPPYNVALVEEGRAIGFSSRDLASFVETPDEAHPIGPLPSRWALSGVETIFRLLRATPTPTVPAWVMSRALGIMPVSAPDAACFWEAWSVFRAQYGLSERTTLTRLERAARVIARKLEVTPRVRRDEEELVWDVDRVVEHFEEALARAPQLVSRARWLCHLSDCEIAYCEPGGSTFSLSVAKAEVTLGGAWEGPLPAPPFSARPRAVRQRDFDVVRYDRLRVLTTELKRVVRDGGTVRIRFGAGPELDGVALERVLRTV
ncbi:MAG: GIY-YIG nuclease family protein [Deltaproteobacteria bacterium]